jgi:hypothetical protein
MGRSKWEVITGDITTTAVIFNLQPPLLPRSYQMQYPRLLGR